MTINYYQPCGLRRQRLPLVLLLWILLLLFGARPELLAATPSQSEAVGERGARMVALLDGLHYRRIEWSPLDFRQSKERFLYALDPNGLFFYRTDIDTLLAIPLPRSQLRSGGQAIPFFDRTLELYRTRLNELLNNAESPLNRHYDSDHNWPEAIDLSLRSTALHFAVDVAARSVRWEKWLRYKTLLAALQINNRRPDQHPSAALLERKLREVIDSERQRLEQRLQPSGGIEADLALLFLNSLAHHYDPHSGYIARNRISETPGFAGKSQRHPALPLPQREQPVLRGYRLEGERRIGYLALRSFYFDTNKERNVSFIRDASGEIERLKESGIEGLILDLRYNGGGSVQESLELAALFIDQGPLLTRTERGATRPRFEMARHSGVLYDGPLVVIVNSESRSAAELFASIMRDYNRALIVGSRTFGKLSGQVILPLVEQRSQLSDPEIWHDESLDILRATSYIYYNLQGHSYQQRGVEPDIHLFGPDDLFTPFYESDLERPLIVPPIPHYARIAGYTPPPRSTLKEKSMKRQASSRRFSELRTIGTELAPQIDNTKEIDLQLSTFFDAMEITLAGVAKLHALLYTEPSDHFTVVPADGAQMTISGDLLIEESYQILLDWH